MGMTLTVMAMFILQLVTMSIVAMISKLAFRPWTPLLVIPVNAITLSELTLTQVVIVRTLTLAQTAPVVRERALMCPLRESVTPVSVTMQVSSTTMVIAKILMLVLMSLVVMVTALMLPPLALATHVTAMKASMMMVVSVSVAPVWMMMMTTEFA